MLDRFAMQAIFAMGTASAGSEHIQESSYINNAAPQLTEFSKSTGSASSLASPSSSLDKDQKRGGGTTVRDTLPEHRCYGQCCCYGRSNILDVPQSRLQVKIFSHELILCL
jgi:hypothetical protein